MARPVILVLEAGGNGGTEVYVEGLARYLAVHGAVYIIALHGDPAALQARFPGLTVAVAGGVGGLRALVRAYPDAVFNLHLYSSLLPAVMVLRLRQIRVVTTLHLTLKPWNVLHRLRWRLAVALSTAVIGVSAACFQGYGVLLRSKRTAIIPGPLPLETLPSAQPLPPLGFADRFEVLCVARLEYQKGLPVLINAIAKLPSTRLTLIGDGSERESLTEQATDLGVDVRLLGALPQKQVFDHLAEAHAFVLPSRFEGLGLAAIEAMALGVPTITANFPASADYIIPGETGLTFARGDSTALAGCLEQLRRDAALRGRLSERGARFVRERFTPDGQYDRYKALLDTVFRSH